MSQSPAGEWYSSALVIALPRKEDNGDIIAVYRKYTTNELVTAQWAPSELLMVCP